VRIKERLVSDKVFTEDEIETIAITMGPPQAKHILMDAISVGIDKAILLSDRAFAGSDTLATSSTLAAAAKKIGGTRSSFSVNRRLMGTRHRSVRNLPIIFGYLL
jgi:electron transfer flavoprotein alpha/beta subunit